MRRAEEHFTLLHYLYIRLYDARGGEVSEGVRFHFAQT
ncbi:hypothetical protein AB434_0441 [Heyndrickxia coagulans]|uniref:Uncharacterized protein n=1 Tax=Heyndrickxia coagulans TaxID=1398 RepID=A0AAN0T3V6_HEYCO|nr:hypothetical protein SB48_HM08orf01130 [Heyndrickxia coagulans]AKN52846.1 hypothetical protein AB434_0441 [Heyndrickxia coagulans]KYC65956.1 hypothetical protein B4100_2067 [Heyndrickxia coagulans]KYC84047.1 hypothetical protein B4096_1974 [Heyndrickxia coagulans]